MNSASKLRIGLAVLAAPVVWVAGDVRAHDTATSSNPTSMTALTRRDPGGPFQLTDHNGRTVSEEDFRGRFLLVFFGYTSCPDICPMTLSDVTSALDILGEDASVVAPLFVSVDPQRDTPEVLTEYISHFHPAIVGLTGTPDQIAHMTEAYRVTYEAITDGQANDHTEHADYKVDHSAYIYLMGPAGDFRTVFANGAAPEKMAARIRREIVKPVPTQ